MANLTHGLTSAEVNASRKLHGTNAITRQKRKKFLRSFFGNFGDPMLKILLIALGINCVFIFNQKNFLETFGIAVAILIAVIVSTVSEQGSEAAFEKLQSAARNIAVRVRRNGKTEQIPIEEIVVGDIIVLGSGDKIPADGIIVQGKIEVDQSTLNGESKEATKHASNMYETDVRNSKSKIDFLDEQQLFCGTVVTNGEAFMRVTSVGDKTIYGKLAAELQAHQPKSPLKVKLEKLAKMISIIGYIGSALVAVAYLFNVLVVQGETFSFSHGLAVATLVVSVIVMAVPEGLPMMITVVLSSNMKHMMRDNVLVRKLNGIETAGSMNILFTDKTGTLTIGKLEVVDVCACPDIQLVGTVLRYCTSAEMSNGKALGGNSTDRILLEYGLTLPYIKSTVKETTPFDSKTKFMATTLTDGRILSKGAPEVILPKCFKNIPSEKQKIIDDLTSKAFRVIACAINNTFVGFVAIRDQVRTEAKTAVKQLSTAGIQTVMITGDAKKTAIAIAKEVGILSSENELVLTSDELASLTDEQLCVMLPKLRVVSRALPADKSRLVRIAQRLGLVAGMTGDGVNDAPALKAADIGFAMGSGTEVAKEAGDVVILDDNINSICKATSYGRTVFKSIRKYLIFKLTINFVAMGISILAPFLGIGVPITVLQMLWINIVMDTLAGLAYGGERPRASYMRESPKRRDEPLINRYMWQQITFASIYIGSICLWFLMSPFIQDGFYGRSVAYAMTAFFAFFMFINILNSFNSRTHDLNPISHLSLNKPFVFIMGGVMIAQVLLIFFGGAIFRTEPLSLKHFILVLILSFTIIPVDVIRKLVIKWRSGGKNGKQQITT